MGKIKFNAFEEKLLGGNNDLKIVSIDGDNISLEQDSKKCTTSAYRLRSALRNNALRVSEDGIVTPEKGYYAFLVQKDFSDEVVLKLGKKKG